MIHPSYLLLMGHFTGLIIILLFFAFLLRVDFIFYIAYVCIGVYLWIRWQTPRQLQKLHIDRVYAAHAFWGEVVPVTVQVENQSRLPVPWLHLRESLAVELRGGSDPLNQVASLHGKETVAYRYTIRSWRRGYYRIGPLRLATGDLFGFIPELKGTVAAQYITIYPHITPLTRLGLPSRLPFGTIGSRQRLFADPARPMGVRAFRSGDSLRQINWKTSAHTQSLVVKTFAPAISLETAVLLDLHSPTYYRKNRISTVEWAIEVAASLAAHLIDRRQPVGLMSNGIDPLTLSGGAGKAEFDAVSGRLLTKNVAAIRAENPHALPAPSIPPGNGRAHLMKLLERLARLEAEETIPLSQWAIPACSHLSWGVTILVITSRGNMTTCQTLHRLVHSGFNPVLIAVEPDHNFGEVRERSRRLGFLAFNVVSTQDLAPWRRSQQGMV